MPTHEAGIVQLARRIASLQHKRRRLRADLRDVEKDIRHAKKELQKVIAIKDDYWPESGAAFKTVGNKAGE